jgi:Stage II sporulation protein E (SpoIIE)
VTGVNHESPWENVPRVNIVIFLAAVFCVFAGVGFATDSVDMGHQPVPRFALSVLVAAGFAVCYAAAGITLRRRFWMGFIPLFIVHFVIMGLLGNRFPGTPEPLQYNALETVRLRHRIALDSIGIMISVVLGYIGFLVVSIREGRRHIRLQGEKASLESEMAAAREIQRVMVPEEQPAIPGYRLESVYRPAAQVGGDFFQVIPVKSGQTLVIVGDVSGKGLTSAMIVSMLVGMLSTITGFTEEPAEILVELNRQLCGRTHGRFVTCGIVRLERGGRLTAANAGHLPPYLNGEEVPFPGSLPLGVSVASVYEQFAFTLDSGDRLFLLTDGIVEAQNKEGQLLGFPRVEKMLREGASAHSLAETAQLYGQADDITAICIERGDESGVEAVESAVSALPVSP